MPTDREVLNQIKLLIDQQLNDPPAQTQEVIINIRSGDNLQAALDRAVIEGSQKPVLMKIQPGTYKGDFIFRKRKGAKHPIRLISDASPSGPGRAHPDDTGWMWKVESLSGLFAFRTEPSADNYHIQGLEILPLGMADRDAFVIDPDYANGNSPNADDQPTYWSFDQVVIRGDVARGLHRGIRCNGRYISVKRSHIDRCFEYGRDCQAIGGWNFTGPIEVEDNFLSASAEIFMTGGAGIYMGAAGVPDGIYLRKNHFWKDPAWKGLYNANNDQIQLKNDIEIKYGKNIEITENLIETNWAQSQSGWTILLTPKPQNYAGNVHCIIQNVLIQNNVIRDVASVINISNQDKIPVLGTFNVQFINNLCYMISRAKHGGDGRFMLVQDGVTGLEVAHNTIMDLDGTAFTAMSGIPSVVGYSLHHNIFPERKYGIHTPNGTGKTGLDNCCPNYEMVDNAIGDYADSGVKYPEGNFMVPEAQFQFENFGPKPGTMLANLTASDGAPIGVDLKYLPKIGLQP